MLTKESLNSGSNSGEITEAMIYEAIADVLDPELDEPLVKLGFIDHVQVNGCDVTVAFKLPTYWCAPNFAYLMAADLRTRVQNIPGVRSTSIQLLDHCTDEEISTNVTAGRSFVEAFPDESEDNLEELRLVFLRKGFLSRQDTLLRKLLKAGLDEPTLLTLRGGDVSIDEASGRVAFATPDQIVHLERSAQIVEAYLRRAALLNLYHTPEDLLFMNEQGQRIAPGGLQAYLRQTRSVRMNIMFNTVFCTDMFQTRYGPNKALAEGEKI